MKAEPCRNRFCKSFHPKAIAYCPKCRNTATSAKADVERALGIRRKG